MAIQVNDHSFRSLLVWLGEFFLPGTGSAFGIACLDSGESGTLFGSKKLWNRNNSFRVNNGSPPGNLGDCGHDVLRSLFRDILYLVPYAILS